MFSLADARDDRVDAAHGNNAIARLHLRITDVRVLREVPDGAVGRDRPRVLGSAAAIGFARKKAHRRRLAGTVSAHQTDAHALINTEARVVDELAGTDTQ